MNLLRKKHPSVSTDLKRSLTAFDLIFLGIGAVIGAGIFVITGIVAATQTGPGIVFSYVIAGIACACAAFAYAELASSIGGCGSTYGYAYAGFGECIAWIIGWDLILEYTISISAVSVSWSGYLNNFLSASDIHIPEKWLTSPLNGGFLDLPACLIVFLLTMILTFNVKTNVRFNNAIVMLKLAVILLFIILASTAINPHNWHPFLPFGWSGVFEGASLIFFAYVGFDAVSTTAEEVINPQKDLPKGIIGALVICSLLYMVVSLLLTGIVPYHQLNVASPISHALILIGYQSAAGLIAIGAIAGLTTVMLVLFYGLSRIFLAMSRDGLLPHFFAHTHPRFHSPIRILWFCCPLIAGCAGLLPLKDLAELVNIGTLFAFMVACAGVIYFRIKKPNLLRSFKTPWFPITPIIGIVSCGYLIAKLPWFTILRFIIWLGLGLLVYCLYGYRHSVLCKATRS